MDGAKLSAAVLSDFFYYLSGVTMIAAIALSMRLIAHERETGHAGADQHRPGP